MTTKWTNPASVSVTTQHKSGKDAGDAVATNEWVDVPPVTGHPAVVTFSAGLTLNLGNYETTRVDVGIQYPCDPAHVRTAYEQAVQWVTTRLEAQVVQIRGSKSKDVF